MKKTGEILKQAREDKGVALKDVAETTKISLATLEAIEKGDLDSLPAKSFLRGFVGSYAKYLGLNVNDILDCFSEEMGTTKPKAAIEPVENSKPQLESVPTETERTVSLKKEKASDVLHTAEQKHPLVKTAIIVGCVVLLIAIVLTKRVVDKYDREAQQVATVSEEALNNDADPVEDVDDISLIEVQDNAVSPAQTSANKGNTQTTDESDSERNDDAGVESQTVENTTTEEKPAQPKVKVEEEKKEEKKKEEKKVTGPIEVVIEALDIVRVDYRPDGGSLESRTLDPEAILTLRANESLNIDFSDGGAVSVKFNGKDLGVPGNLGQPHKLRLP